MSLINILPTLIFLILLIITSIHAATFDVVNQCGYTVWAAASPGGGRRLDQGQTWTFNVATGTRTARIWGRTNCKFNNNGQGRCESGDCKGGLVCQGFGSPPNTLAEFTLNKDNDFFDISLVDGFNIPMDFTPTNGSCRGIRCAAPDMNVQCPAELRIPGGCNNPCIVFKTNEYCCTSGSSCGPTRFSMFFKQRCPNAYSYPLDDKNSLFTCPGGTDYRVTFCP